MEEAKGNVDVVINNDMAEEVNDTVDDVQTPETEDGKKKKKAKVGGLDSSIGSVSWSTVERRYNRHQSKQGLAQIST